MTNSNYHRIDFFCWNFAHFPIYQMPIKGVRENFLLFRSWIICNNKKDLVSVGARNQDFAIFSITQDLIKRKKNLEHVFVDIDKWRRCVKLQQKILSYMEAGACQSFLGKNRALSKFRYRILVQNTVKYRPEITTLLDTFHLVFKIFTPKDIYWWFLSLLSGIYSMLIYFIKISNFLWGYWFLGALKISVSNDFNQDSQGHFHNTSKISIAKDGLCA